MWGLARTQPPLPATSPGLESITTNRPNQELSSRHLGWLKKTSRTVNTGCFSQDLTNEITCLRDTQGLQGEAICKLNSLKEGWFIAIVCWDLKLLCTEEQAVSYSIVPGFREANCQPCSCRGVQTLSFKGCIYKWSRMAIKPMTLLLLESHKKFSSCSSPKQIRVLQLLVPGSTPAGAITFLPHKLSSELRIQTCLLVWALNSGSAAAFGTF